MKANIITIGDEILIGQVTDTNSAWLGKQLSKEGILVDRIFSIPDTEQDIIDTLNAIEKDISLVIMTGGLGPTKDDVTKLALANHTKGKLIFNETLYLRIKRYFESRNFPVTNAIHQQCHLPDTATILENKMGSAPGMLFVKDHLTILSLPGVPYEMKWIFENSFKPHLDAINDHKHQFQHCTIRTVGMGETRIEESIRDIIEDFPENMSIAYLPSLGQVRLRLTLKSINNNFKHLDYIKDRITERLGSLVYGYGDISLEQSVQNLFIKKKLTLSTAESCTGGYIAHRITAVPDSSQYYHGTVVSYDNMIKKSVLSVSESTLSQHGAVSEQTVVEMLKGLFKVMNTDLGVAVSGIAGPGGGTPEKPVGTIWLAWGTRNKIMTEKLLLSKNRTKNIEYTATAALNRLRLFLTH